MNSINHIFQVLRSNVCTLLNVMVSNAAPRSTVCSRLPVTTTCILLLLEDGITLLLDSGNALEEDSTELLLESGTSLEEDSSITTSLLDEGVSLLEDGASLLLDFALEEDCSELEDAMLELLFSEELLGTTELDEGSSLLLDSSLEELGGSMLEEDSTELEEATLLEDCFTVILPVAEVLLSMPVTAIV